MSGIDNHPLRVALVGKQLPDNENLALAYLKAALLESGHTVDIYHLNTLGELTPTASSIVRGGYGLVGISLSDGGTANVPLSFGEMLRRRGFCGHVTCGGPFATLARRWLLERYGWLDSVIRFAGERPLAELAARLANEVSLDGVPGLTTRHGDGAPAPVCDDMPMRLRPVREELGEILGHRAAHVAAARGCPGGCSYCGPAALQSLERHEGKRSGAQASTLADLGVGGVRRRDIADIADEMADLWHTQDVRYFRIVDEHLLPFDEAEALSLLAKWRAALKQRRVGRLGIGANFKADKLSPAIINSLADLGLVRAFVGLELATPEEARLFNRTAPDPAHIGRVLTRLSERGVGTISNLMLTHPFSTADTVKDALTALSNIPVGVVSATEMQVYHGTRLHRRMADAGQLIGNPIKYHYALSDQAAERFRTIIYRLNSEGFSNSYTIAFHTHDAQVMSALFRRLYPQRARDLDPRRFDALGRSANRFLVDVLHRALALAREGGDFRDALPLIRYAREQESRLRSALCRYEAELQQLSQGGRTFAPMRAAAAGVLSVVMIGAATGGCYRSGSAAEEKSTSSEVETDTESPIDTETNIDQDPVKQSDTDSPAETDSASSEDTASDTDSDTDSDTVTVCSEEDIARDSAEMTALIHENDPCFSGSVGYDGDGEPFTQFTAWYENSPVYMERCYNSDDSRREEMEASALAAIGDRYFPCLPATTPEGYSPRVSRLVVTGGFQDDTTRVASLLETQCDTTFGLVAVVIVVDDAGTVVDVRPRRDTTDTVTLEAIDCVRSALEGLTFPCYAGLDICHGIVLD